MKDYKTSQEEFWAGEFGDEYINRNYSDQLIAGNINLFSRVLSRTNGINRIVEFGPNIGMNLIAISKLLPNAELNAVEINKKAFDVLSANPKINAVNETILNYVPEVEYDFVLIKGVLIHISPDELSAVYEALYNSSKKYICLVEYYNPTPVELSYRGHEGKLYKRDFAGEMLDKYPELKLVDYGFTYHRDNNFPQDDANWFLMEK